MRVKVENLGYIHNGDVEIAPLTIIVGRNNTGKTYLSYAISYFLATFAANLNIEIADVNEQNQLVINQEFLSKKLKEVTRLCSRSLYKAFACDSDMFKGTKMNFSLDVAEVFTFLKEKVKNPYHDTPIKELAGLQIIGYEKNGDVILEFSASDEGKEALSFFAQPGLKALLLSASLANLLKEYINVFPISSERTGISLFYKELDYTKSMILDLLKEKNINKTKYLDIVRETTARYAFPIRENINTVRATDIIKKKSIFAKEKNKFKHLFELWEKLLNGKFVVEDETLMYINKESEQKIPMHIASSASKSLYLLDIFTKNIAQKDQMLIIDEPEMNLHPEAQRFMARFLVQLVNSGVKVILTTHSDYIIREINNLIMLFNLKLANKKKFLRSLGYFDSEMLDPKTVRAYMCENHKVILASQNEYGVNLGSFDGFISQSNNISDQIIDQVNICKDYEESSSIYQKRNL